MTMLICDKVSLDRTATVIKVSRNASQIVVLNTYSKTHLNKLFSSIKFLIEVINSVKNGKTFFICLTNKQILYTTLILLYPIISPKSCKLFFPEFVEFKSIFDRTVFRYINSLYTYSVHIFPSIERKILHEWQSKLYLGNIEILPNNGHRYENTIKSTVTLKKNSTAVYMGVLDPSRPIESEIKQAIANNMFIHLYGSGDESYIKSLVAIDKQMIQYFGSYTPKDEIEILSQYTVGIVSYPNTTLNNYFCASNKEALYRSLGLKIITCTPNTLLIRNSHYE